MSEKKSKSISDEEWENRILCVDESCIGTIGRDGRCRHCGLAYDGELPPSESPLQEGAADEMGEDALEESSATISSDDYSDDNNDAADDRDAVHSGTLEIDYDDWDSRVLCSDESCIGVIGPDDRCKECGKPR
jgi:hypothetical protein